MENQCCFHIPVLHDGETPLAWQSPGEEALCLVEQQVNGGEWKTAYQGKCETVPAPAVGRTWQACDADGLSWLQCETADRDWRAWEAQCETLLDWAGRDARLQTWSQWEAAGESWAARDAPRRMPIRTAAVPSHCRTGRGRRRFACARAAAHNGRLRRSPMRCGCGKRFRRRRRSAPGSRWRCRRCCSRCRSLLSCCILCCMTHRRCG